MSKPNCYDCIHRGELPGDAHSCCNHPETSAIHEDPLASILGILGKRSGGVTIASQAAHKLKIKGDPHGIRMGWFIWPLNFDPVWLESCEGFTEKMAVKS